MFCRTPGGLYLRLPLFVLFYFIFYFLALAKFVESGRELKRNLSSTNSVFFSLSPKLITFLIIDLQWRWQRVRIGY